MSFNLKENWVILAIIIVTSSLFINDNIRNQSNLSEMKNNLLTTYNKSATALSVNFNF